MKIKRSIALPAFIDKWLERKSKKDGLSVSALVTHFLMNAFKDDK